MYEAYFDESGTHADSYITIVAGYLFDDRKYLEFDQEWRKILSQEGVPYFHMSECAHRKSHWKKRSREDCDRVAKSLHVTLKANADVGFVSSMCENDFKTLKPSDWPADLGPYAFCVSACLLLVSAWFEQLGQQRPVKYRFEAGHHHQGQTDAALKVFARSARFIENADYHDHKFLPKEDAAGLQAADILAWEWFQDEKRRGGIENRPRRKSLSNLLEMPHLHHHFRPAEIKQAFQDPDSGRILSPIRIIELAP